MRPQQLAPGVQQRPSGYTYRQRVPVDIRSALGKNEIVLSLRTSRLSVANKRARVLAGEVQQMFNKVRIRLGKLDHCAARSIAENWKRRTLNEDFERRLSGRETIKLDDRDHEQVVNRLLEDRNQMSFRTIRSSVDTLSEKHGIDSEVDAADWRRLAYYMTRAHVDMLNEVHRRNHDPLHEIEHFNDDAGSHSEVKSTKQIPTITEALLEWESDDEEDRAIQTIKEWRRSIRVFVQFFGNLRVDAITSTHLRQYYKKCKQLPKHLKGEDRQLSAKELLKKYQGRSIDRISPASAKKMFSGVRSVLETAVQNEHITHNPAVGIRLSSGKKKTEKPRYPYSSDDLKVIFGTSPLYYRVEPEKYRGEAGYWIPLIALYHGMRLEEIGQLRLTDIKTEAGIPYMNVDTVFDDQSLKTATSIRMVPIHHAVRDLGFLDYIEKLRRSRQTHVFPLLDHSRDKCTRAFSKWINRHFREVCGITDRKKVFHSFRHTFKDACRDAGIDPDIHHRLTGHAGQSVGDGYGAGHSLNVLNEAIQKVAYLIQPPRWK